MGNILVSSNPSHNFKIEKILIRKVDGTMLDLTGALLNCNIKLSLESLAHGSIAFRNEANILAALENLTGQEYMYISLASGSGDKHYHKTFTKVFRCLEASFVSETLAVSPSQQINFMLSPPLMPTNLVGRYSHHYTSSNPTDIILDVLTKYDQTEYDIKNFEKTAGIGDISFSLNKPLDVINHMVNLATSEEQDSNKLYFFENINGYNFKSVATIKGNTKERPKYSMLIKDFEDQLDWGTSEQLHLERMDGYKISDNISNFNKAAFGANVLTTSIINKSFDFHKTNRIQVSRSRGLLNTHTALGASETIEPVEPLMPYNKSFLYSSDSVYKNKSTNILGHDKALAAIEETILFSKKISVTTAGNTNLTVGDKIYLELYNYDNANRDLSGIDPNLTGTWIIYSQEFIFNLNQFEADYILISDSAI